MPGGGRGDGKFVGAEFAPLRGDAGRLGGLAAGAVGVAGTAADQLGDGREFAGCGPGLGFLPPDQDTDQLVIVQTVVVAAAPGGTVNEPGQRRAG